MCVLSMWVSIRLLKEFKKIISKSIFDSMEIDQKKGENSFKSKFKPLIFYLQ